MPPRFYGTRVLTLLLVCGAALAQRPDDAKRERGKRLLAAMPALKPGERIDSFFAQMVGPTESIGYLVASVIAEEADGGVVYRYDVNTYLRFNTNARIEATILGRLRPSFEPIELELRRRFITPEGKSETIVNRAVVSGTTVTLTSVEGDKSKTQEVPRPPSPFVFAMETLIQRLDLSGFEDFVLAEFNPQSGKVGELTFVAQSTADGLKTVLTFMANDQPSYQFWLDEKGRLQRWGEPGSPVVSRTSTPERLGQIRAELLAAAEEWAAKEKTMQPKGPGK